MSAGCVYGCGDIMGVSVRTVCFEVSECLCMCMYILVSLFVCFVSVLFLFMPDAPDFFFYLMVTTWGR